MKAIADTRKNEIKMNAKAATGVPIAVLGGAAPIASLGGQGKVNVTKVDYLMSCLGALLGCALVRCDT